MQYPTKITFALGLFLCLGNCRYVNAVLVAPGETFNGSGVVSEDLVNHGRVIGNGPEAGDRLVFDTGSTVSGAGYFENTLVLGTMSPGNSPGIVTGTNQAFGGTLVIELGGPTPGFSSNNHDQINDLQTLSLFGLPTLNVVSFDGYIPTPGDTFEILTWQTALVGSFGTITYDPIFAINGITFTESITNPTGPGNFTLTAVPEPSAFLFGGAVCGLIGLRAVRQRKNTKSR